MAHLDAMDRNPMLQGLMNPVPNLGVIPGKAVLDWELVNEFRKNAESPATNMYCYPNGGQDFNHDINIGDAIFSQRHVRNGDIADGEPNEMGIAAIAGLCYDNYISQRHTEDDFVWIGVAASAYRVAGHHLNEGTYDPDHGFSTIRAGTVSVINNGWKTFYPGDLICWKFPEAPFHPRAQSIENFNGGDPINYLARQGVEPSQWRPIYEPFDPTDFSVHYACAYACLSAPREQGGIMGIPFEELCQQLYGVIDRKPLSCAQEEAGAELYGQIHTAFTWIHRLARRGLIQINGAAQPASEDEANQQVASLLQQLGAFDENDAKDVIKQCIADCLLANLPANSPDRNSALARFREATGGREFFSIATTMPQRGNITDMWARLRAHGSDLRAQGVTGTWWSKCSKIVGRAMNAAAPADSIDGLFGHTTL